MICLIPPVFVISCAVFLKWGLASVEGFRPLGVRFWLAYLAITSVAMVSVGAALEWMASLNDGAPTLVDEFLGLIAAIVFGAVPGLILMAGRLALVRRRVRD